MTADQQDVVYRGTASSRIVTIESSEGEPLGELRHVLRHSPDGFAWGYGGSGPADLARSLLIDALGEQALCSTCAGKADVVYDGGTVALRPFDPARDDPADESRGRCPDCDDGYAEVIGQHYQQFKFDVVARWPLGGAWRVTRREVWAWLADRGVSITADRDPAGQRKIAPVG